MLWNHRLPLKLKEKSYKMAIRTAMFYGPEGIRLVEMIMLRKMSVSISRD